MVCSRGAISGLGRIGPHHRTRAGQQPPGDGAACGSCDPCGIPLEPARVLRGGRGALRDMVRYGAPQCLAGRKPPRCCVFARHFLAWQSVISGRSKSSSMIRMWTRRRLVSSRSKLWKSASKLCSRAMNRSFRSYRARRWPRARLRDGYVWGITSYRRPSCAGAIAVASRTSSGCTGPLRTDDRFFDNSHPAAPRLVACGEGEAADIANPAVWTTLMEQFS